ncbi:MAG: helix-turn-helix transcriptional regulator [Eubacterium sp.]|nr:helix-turn-helix transcriptional regulator [Eubacterium sp.]
MDLSDFPARLKKLRVDKSIKVSDVSSYLGEHLKPVSEKTIYGWESGVSMPSSKALLTLCEMYDVSDIRTAFDSSKTPPDTEGSPMHFLTPREWELVKSYRDRPEIKAIVRKIYDLDN